MKKILGLITIAILSVSCLNKSYYNGNYTSFATFNNFSTKDFPDSVFFKGAFYDPYASRLVDLVFYNNYDKDKDEFKGGFAMSMKRDSSFVIDTEKNPYPNFTAYTNPLAKETKYPDGFVVFFDNGENNPKQHCIFSQKDFGTCAIQYCYVTNTQPVVEYFKNQKGFPDPSLADSENLKLTITGYLKGAETNHKDYYLACKDSVNVRWAKIPLSTLGNIDEIKFSLETTGTDDCLKYCCLDNFVANTQVKY